jgi:hypothetical protein
LGAIYFSIAHYFYAVNTKHLFLINKKAHLVTRALL